MQTDAELVAAAEQVHLEDAFFQILLPDLDFLFEPDGFDHKLNLKGVAVVVFKNLLNRTLLFNINHKSFSSELRSQSAKKLHLDLDLLWGFEVLPSEEDLVAWRGFKRFNRGVFVLC